MKTYFSIIFIAITTLNSFALGEDMVANDLDPDKFGVRVLLIGTDEYCNGEDVALIQDSFGKAFSGNLRNLRTSRQLAYDCNRLCRGWAPGHCYLGYRQCSGWRLLEEVEEDAEAFFFEEEEITIEDYQGNERHIQISDAATAICQSQKQIVMATLTDDLASSSLSSSCNALLSQPILMECFMIR